MFHKTIKFRVFVLFGIVFFSSSIISFFKFSSPNLPILATRKRTKNVENTFGEMALAHIWSRNRYRTGRLPFMLEEPPGLAEVGGSSWRGAP